MNIQDVVLKNTVFLDNEFHSPVIYPTPKNVAGLLGRGFHFFDFTIKL